MSGSAFHRWRRAIRAVLCAAGMALAGHAQSDDPLDDPWWRPGIHAEEFEQVVGKLNFEDGTSEALFRAMYQEFVDRHRAAAGAAYARLKVLGEEAQRWREEHPDLTWVDEPEWGWREAGDAWTAERDAIETQFQQDVELFLGSEQAATWERLTQGIRRERALFHHSVEQHPLYVWCIDLEKILDDLGVVPNGELNAALNAWSDEFDRAVRRREDEQQRYLEWAKTASLPLIQDMSEAELSEYIDASLPAERARFEISMVSKRWAAAVAALLSEENAGRFLDAARRAALPQAFRDSPVEALLGKLDELPLSAAQRAMIRDIAANQYEARQQGIRARLMQAYEDGAAPDGIEERWRDWRAAVRAGEIDPSRAFSTNHPSLPLWIENRQLSLEACRAIRTLIPQEEFEKLPFSARLWLSWWEE